MNTADDQHCLGNHLVSPLGGWDVAGAVLLTLRHDILAARLAMSIWDPRVDIAVTQEHVANYCFVLSTSSTVCLRAQTTYYCSVK